MQWWGQVAFGKEPNPATTSGQRYVGPCWPELSVATYGGGNCVEQGEAHLTALLQIMPSVAGIGFLLVLRTHRTALWTSNFSASSSLSERWGFRCFFWRLVSASRTRS